MSFFANRPVFAMVISIIIVIIGFQAMQGLPVAQYPEITPPEVRVDTTYTGASAVDIEESVATPIEQKVNGVEDMIYMRSINSNDGTLSLRVSFEVGADLDMANVLVQNRLSEAEPGLPEEVKSYGVTVKKALSFPLMLVSLYSPEGSYDNNFLSNYANINIVDAISRIRGVGQVNLFGGSDYAMRVWVQPDRLARLSMTVSDVIAALRAQNVITPGGQLGGPPAPAGTEFTYTVRTQGRLATPEEFAQVVLRSNPDGSQVRLQDVARVELGTQLYDSQGRLDGQDAAVIAIYQLPDANGLDVAQQVGGVMEEIRQRFPADLDYDISLDTTKAVEAGIEEILITLAQALTLVILVVFVFLQSWRATVIPLLAIPVALIGTFAFFPLLGFSINVLSLLGLVLAIGMLVDDAIVIVEAVTVHIEAGLSPREATVKAMGEVGGPVVATSLILMAVFVPVGFMGGITGRLYQQFAITIAISVAVSTINALTLSPALAALLLRPAGESKGLLARGFAVFNRALDRITGGYTGVASYLARRLVRGTILVAATVAGAMWLGVQLPTGFVPEEDQGYLIANVQLPDAASLQRTDVVCREAEKILMSTPGIRSTTTVTGFSLLTGSRASNTGFFFIQLEPWKERGEGLVANSILRQLNQRFAAIEEGVVIAFGPPPIPGLGTSAGFTMMLQDRSGGDPRFLAKQAEAFTQAATARPEIQRAFTTYRASVPQVFAKVDRDKVLKLGLSLEVVNQTLAAFLGGSYVNDFNRFGRLYKVYVQAEPEFRQDADQLKFFFVRGPQGERIPLTTLVTVEPTAGPQYTNRFNLFRAAEISGAPAPGYSSAQALDALEEVAAEVLPPEMSYEWSNISYQERVSSGSAGQTFLLAMIFVFLILAALYESWSLPVSVLLGTPFAVLGAFAALFLARAFIGESYLNNVFAQIGLVMLIGLSAKNAILIVEFARNKRDEGASAFEAAIEAARDRFRPILMTAFSSLLGFLPLLVATGAGAEARKVIGMGVFGGLFAATILGVLLVPMLYVLVEKLAGNAEGRPPEPAPVPATGGEEA